MANNGGPAFPTPWAGGTNTEGGMSLRDYFAGLAMQGNLAHEGWSNSIAEFSYEIADAMIAERGKAK